MWEEKQAFEVQSFSTTYGKADTRYVCCLNMNVPEPFRMWCPYWFSSSGHRHLPKELYTRHKIRRHNCISLYFTWCIYIYIYIYMSYMRGTEMLPNMWGTSRFTGYPVGGWRTAYLQCKWTLPESKMSLRTAKRCCRNGKVRRTLCAVPAFSVPRVIVQSQIFTPVRLEVML